MEFLLPARRLASRKSWWAAGCQRRAWALRARHCRSQFRRGRGAHPHRRQGVAGRSGAERASCRFPDRGRRHGLSSDDGVTRTSSPIRGPRRLGPAEAAAVARQAPRARRASACSASDLLAFVEGSISSSCGRRDSGPRALHPLLRRCLAGRRRDAVWLAAACCTAATMRAVSRKLTGMAEPPRSAIAVNDVLYHVPERRALAGRGDLHPRANAPSTRPGSAPGQCRAASETAARRWRDCSADIREAIDQTRNRRALPILARASSRTSIRTTDAAGLDAAGGSSCGSPGRAATALSGKAFREKVRASDRARARADRAS